MSETRRAPGAQFRAVRAQGGSKRQFVCRALTYNTIDSYGTRWLPGCFAESLRQKLPVVAWSHSWDEPIGRYIEVVRDDATALELVGQLDDFDDVPRARQAYSQMQSGTITDFSVGFTRQKWTNVDDASLRALGCYEEMVKAGLDEVSPVIVGAVPGTALLATRSARRRPADAALAAVRLQQLGRARGRNSEEERALLDADDALQMPWRRR